MLTAIALVTIAQYVAALGLGAAILAAIYE